ncbi:MAG: hypothetical protein U0869_04735 [Chloroflexota bacterium]
MRQLVKEGADFVKIVSSGGSTRSFTRSPAFTPPELAGRVVDEAHRFGKLTGAHSVPHQRSPDCSTRASTRSSTARWPT